ncbi:hypothetical protein F444_02459 [Phytophthora nicotianae P1976]|uniref:Uncharacterized protein n=1 Tax=Phytophthora nicotianae P1976 TaxID=1317066 RepID=A0A081AXD4_PHYNI|nr:hypothetical protein F444_02459 [Phytophthora nicotianae P1976]
MYVFSIDWAINTPHAVVYGDLEPPEADKKCSTQLRKLLDAGVSYIVQKIAVQGKAAFIETASGPASGFDFIDSSLEQLAGTVAISMCDLAEPETMGLFVTVTKTAKTQFQLSLDLWEMTGQYVQHAGSMLSLMLSGSASSLLEVFRCAQSVPLAVICWNISSYMVEPVCSAIANIKSALNVTLDLNDLVSEPISDWGWLVYAVCCGSTHSNEWNLRVSSASMTQRDLDVIDHGHRFFTVVKTLSSWLLQHATAEQLAIPVQAPRQTWRVSSSQGTVYAQ